MHVEFLPCQPFDAAMGRPSTLLQLQLPELYVHVRLLFLQILQLHKSLAAFVFGPDHADGR